MDGRVCVVQFPKRNVEIETPLREFELFPTVFLDKSTYSTKSKIHSFDDDVCVFLFMKKTDVLNRHFS